jgi:hypothetical protein
VPAFGAYSRARALWLAENGIGHWDYAAMPPALRSAGAPWSFHDRAATDPKALAATLERLGLPKTWRPTPAPAEWLKRKAS